MLVEQLLWSKNKFFSTHHSTSSHHTSHSSTHRLFDHQNWFHKLIKSLAIRHLFHPVRRWRTWGFTSTALYPGIYSHKSRAVKCLLLQGLCAEYAISFVYRPELLLDNVFYIEMWSIIENVEIPFSIMLIPVIQISLQSLCIRFINGLRKLKFSSRNNWCCSKCPIVLYSLFNDFGIYALVGSYSYAAGWIRVLRPPQS